MMSTILPRSELAGLAAIVTGTGRPVLFLHGVGLRAEAWDAQIKALRDTHTVIAPDMPGHGQSPCMEQGDGLDDYVQAVLPLLRMLDDPALVVGHSMGAMIALEIASVAPECVNAVVACNAIFERNDGAKAAVQARAASLDGLTLPNPKSTLNRWFGTVQSVQRSACDEWLRMADPLGYKKAYTAFAFADGPSRRALNSLKCPALFATGSLEPNSTPEMSQIMADLTPQGRALIIEGAAHMMPMTHAAEVNLALTALTKDIWP